MSKDHKDPKKAAAALYDAMKGFGTNEKKIIDTLVGLDNETIQQVREEFQSHYHKDLIKEIKSETSGLGTNDEQLIEVLVTRHPDHLKKVVAFFQKQYGTSVEEYVAGDTSGDYKEFLLALAGANRDSNSAPVDAEKAEEDCQKLFRAGEGTVGTDEKVFIQIFAKRSWKHLRKVAEDYAKRYSHSLHTALDKEFNGDIFHALKWTHESLAKLYIVEFVENRQAFFAKRIHHSFSGLGTHDKTLVRILISRLNVDLYEIADSYNTIFGKSLKEALHSELSGDYRTLVERLLAASE